MIHHIYVEAQTVSPVSLTAGIQYSQNIDFLQVHFSSEWEGFSCLITFFLPERTPLELHIGQDPFAIPPEVLEFSGPITYVFSGYHGESQRVSLPARLIITSTRRPGGNVGEETTPSLIGQLLETAERAENAVRMALPRPLDDQGNPLSGDAGQSLIADGNGGTTWGYPSMAGEYDYVNRAEFEAVMANYVTDIAALVGGEA